MKILPDNNIVSNTGKGIENKQAWHMILKAGVDNWDAWVAESVEHPTLVFGSGRGLRVVGWSPALCGVCLFLSLPPLPLLPPPPLTCAHTLSQVDE